MARGSLHPSLWKAFHVFSSRSEALAKGQVENGRRRGLEDAHTHEVAREGTSQEGDVWLGEGWSHFPERLGEASAPEASVTTPGPPPGQRTRLATGRLASRTLRSVRCPRRPLSREAAPSTHWAHIVGKEGEADTRGRVTFASGAAWPNFGDTSPLKLMFPLTSSDGRCWGAAWFSLILLPEAAQPLLGGGPRGRPPSIWKPGVDCTLPTTSL